MNGKLAILASAIIAAACAHAAKELVDGYTWSYSVSAGAVTITGVEPLSGDVVIPSQLGGYPVRAIGSSFLYDQRGIKTVKIPSGVQSIGYRAFDHSSCAVEIPGTVTYLGDNALYDTVVLNWHVKVPISINYGVFWWNASVEMLEVECDVWNGILGCLDIAGYTNLIKAFRCKRQYAKNWIKLLGVSKFAGYIDDMPEVEIVSSSMRKDDPTVMDVVYKVCSSAKTVKVRAMAWENGERNLSKAIRPTKWIEGTEANIGDAVTANEEHKLSWRIAGDWATDLSKVKLEVLAVEDDLLPLELQTIPATATHQKMKISWNKMTADHVFDALLWLYADGNAGLTLTNGQLKNGTNILASGTGLYNTNGSVGYVFGKMGYQVLSGDELAYARRVTQLDLPVSGVQQYAVKYPDAK